MRLLRLVSALAVPMLLTACYRKESSYDSTFPEPTEISGPPSGEIDPEWQGQGVAAGSSSGTEFGYVEPSSDPQDPGYVMGTVTATEIDTTLEAYGEWVELDDYGRVWRPYATEVGVDFTPYETCGTWVWTDYGWTFACEWDWGWLPFHYGRWGWFDDYWAWAPDYEWTPAAVEWRGGGGYVGWRPLAPIVRDHRGEHTGPVVRDHRTARARDSHWRFAAVDDFGKSRIRARLFKNPAEGLQVTSVLARPPVRANLQPIRAASLMRGRLGVRGAPPATYQPAQPTSRPSPPSRPLPNNSSSRPSRPVPPSDSSWSRPSRPVPPSPSDSSWSRPSPSSRPVPSNSWSRPEPSRPPSNSSGSPPSRPSSSPPSSSSSSSSRPSSSSRSRPSGSSGSHSSGGARSHRR